MDKNQILKKTDQFICWFPKKGPHSLVRRLQDYRIFHKISRTVHFDEFKEVRELQKFSPNKFHTNSHSHLGSRYPSCEVLWFGAHDPHVKNNYYGNVSFVIDIRTLMREHVRHLKFYFVEVLDFKTANASRILLSHKEYDLPLYDPFQYGGPWYIDPSGDHYHLTEAPRYDEQSNKNGHKLEFMFEVTEDMAKKFYYQSKPIPASHEEANSGKPFSCKNHGPDKKCPSPWKMDEAQTKIEELLKTPRKKAKRTLEL